MSGGLKIAPGLTLDPDYIGAGTLGLLAKKGAGKSYTARVMAEEMWDAKVPFAYLDPMGTTWGLRSTADGNDKGIPVAIFGGEHGDAPLERGAGALMADLVVDEGLSMVLDLSNLGTRAAEREFSLHFLERLYRRNRELVHVFMDEADLFAPQSFRSAEAPLVGVTENIVRRGRNRGIGITLMTQRPAVLNKDVLTQVDALVAMRMVGLNDREAIDKWLEGHGDDPELAKTVKGTLASLENGECWWWIPELGILKRVRVRQARTFDSSPSKKRGARARQPKSFADVDMGAISGKIEATIERARADDPKLLRARNRELETEMRKLRDRPATQAEPIEVRVEVVPEWVGDRASDLRIAATAVGDVPVRDAGPPIVKLADSIASYAKDVARLELGGPASGGRASASGDASSPRQPARRPPPPPVAATAAAPVDGEFRPSRPQQKILDALAMLETIGVDAADKTQLALFAEASPRSSGYEKNLSTLRNRAGLIEYPGDGRAALTDAGRAVADAGGAPQTVAELHEFVRRFVKPTKARILDVLIGCYPDAMPKDVLAEQADMSPTSSGYEKALSTLRSLGLIDYPQPGYAVALPVLFLGTA